MLFWGTFQYERPKQLSIALMIAFNIPGPPSNYRNFKSGNYPVLNLQFFIQYRKYIPPPYSKLFYNSKPLKTSFSNTWLSSHGLLFRLILKHQKLLSETGRILRPGDLSLLFVKCCG